MLEFCRQLRVPDFIGIKIDHIYPDAVLCAVLAKIMKARTPESGLSQIFRHALGEKDMACVAAIHHSLGNVNSSARHVRSVVYVLYLIDRAAVDAHAQPNVRRFLERLADLNRAANRRLGAIEKDERHSIARGNSDQPASCFRGLHLLRFFDDLTKSFLELPLFIQKQLRITNHVHKQDVPNFQLNIRFRILSHITSAWQK